MKSLLPLSLLLISSVAMSNGKTLATRNSASAERYIIADSSKAQIPTIAILGIPDNLTILSRYQQMKKCGITESYYFFPNANSMNAALDVAEKAGLKLFVACPEIKSDPETTVKRFMNHPALAGYFIADEPNVNTFASLSKLIKRIRAIDDQHACYVNLFPNNAKPSLLGVDSYEDYLAAFVKQVPAQILSFDNYPILGDTKDAIREDWYQNLELVANQSKKSNRPFWAFALTVATLNYPVPTLGALRLQVYSNLAYGAQGIQYFTYWTPGNGKFRNGPIGSNGKPSEVYGYLQQINKEIKDLSGVFLGAKLISISHSGHVPKACKSVRNLPKPITSFQTDNIGAVISVLENHEKKYLVVVNRDFTDEMHLQIKCMPGVSQVLKDGTYVKQDQNTNKVSIGPGDIAIFSWPESMDQ